MMTKKILATLSVAINIFWQTAGFVLAAFYLIYRFFIPLTKGIRFLSLFFRRVFEKKNAKNHWSIGLMTLIFVANFFLSPFSGRPELKNTSIIALAYSDSFAAPEKAITTETTYQKPTQGWLSQGYNWYHPAVDIVTVMGEKVYPIAEGKVYLVEYTTWGYGNFLVIEQNDGYKSLYAHLEQIMVQPGDKVKKTTLLANVGMTGRTTGPHLHLEIYNTKEGNINPVDVVPGILWCKL